MKLLLIRDAPAVRNGSVGIRDGERPLTPLGRKRFRVAARGLARIVERPDVLLTSPLVRARATAEIAAAAFKKLTPQVEPALGRDDLDAVVAALRKYSLAQMVAVVGRGPTLSGFLARDPACTRTTMASRPEGRDFPPRSADGPNHGVSCRWFRQAPRPPLARRRVSSTIMATHARGGRGKICCTIVARASAT